MEKSWETSYDPIIHEPIKTIKKIPVANNVSTPIRGDFKLSAKDFDLLKQAEDVRNDNYIGPIPDGDESHRGDYILIYHKYRGRSTKQRRFGQFEIS